jgi:hypothetical protein
MATYSSGDQIGYDEISFNPSNVMDFNSNLGYYKSSDIKERERKLQQKINDMVDTKPMSYRDMWEKRKLVAEIEDTQIANHHKQVLTQPQRTESFEAYANSEKLRRDLIELERKNDMFIMLIFFLFVIVVIQYSRINNDGPAQTHYVIVPVPDKQTQGQPTNAAVATPSTVIPALTNAVPQ